MDDLFNLLFTVHLKQIIHFNIIHNYLLTILIKSLLIFNKVIHIFLINHLYFNLLFVINSNILFKSLHHIFLLSIIMIIHLSF